jgi:DNA-binding Lrp family transcriptional regulator
MKPVNIKFVGDAAVEWKKLNKVVAEERTEGIENSENQQLLKSIKQKIELIKINPQYGDSVKKKMIPKKFPEVQEIHNITGDWDIIIKVKVEDVDAVGKFVLDKLRTVKGIEKTSTRMVVDTAKETLYTNL